MRDARFDWSDAKARGNLKKHGVTFEAARLVFDDPASVDEIDDREDYEEDRFIIIGSSHRQNLLVVVHTERGDNIRIISARHASRTERRDYEEGD